MRRFIWDCIICIKSKSAIKRAAHFVAINAADIVSNIKNSFSKPNKKLSPQSQQKVRLSNLNSRRFNRSSLKCLFRNMSRKKSLYSLLPKLNQTSILRQAAKTMILAGLKRMTWIYNCKKISLCKQ